MIGLGLYGVGPLLAFGPMLELPRGVITLKKQPGMRSPQHGPPLTCINDITSNVARSSPRPFPASKNVCAFMPPSH